MTDEHYMLDTNIASYLIRNRHPELDEKIEQTGVGRLCISCITEAELRFGCLKHPDNKQLHELVDAFLVRVNCLPWDTHAAVAYAAIRAGGEAEGVTLSNMDMLIGAHAASINATLVTNDSAFQYFKKWITCENWIGP